MNFTTIFPKGILIITFLVFIINSGLAQNNLLPDTIRSCQVDSLELALDVDDIFDSYLWSTGDTTPSTWVLFTGDYWVNVTQGDTVDISDTTFVNIVDAKIAEPDTTIACKDTITLHGSSSLFDYIWADSISTIGDHTFIPDTSIIGIEDSVIVYPRDTVFYYAEITDPVSLFYCFDSVKVTIEPIMVVDTIIQFQMDCKDSAYAKVQVEISGGYPPYSYEWSEGTPYYDEPKVKDVTDGPLQFVVTDTIGCYIKDEFEVKAFPLPEINLYTDPDSLVYIQKPYVHFSYENVSYDSLGVDTFRIKNGYFWDFGDNVIVNDIASPTHTYTSTGTYNIIFDYKTWYDCPGLDSISMEVKPVELIFPNAFTPNNDGMNEVFEIYEDDGSGGGENGGGDLKSYASEEPVDLSKYYISNKLVVFNRWGQQVFETENYQNDWDGSGLIDGVYFYLLVCEGETESPTYKGSVTILRGQM